MADRLFSDSALVQFSERLTNSAAFGNLFRGGMDLVEETAAYLDGVGRTEAKALDRAVSLTYATESMRLTTRLMQLASWLLLHRAVVLHREVPGQERARRAGAVHVVEVHVRVACAFGDFDFHETSRT